MGLPVPEIVQCPHCQAENSIVEERCGTCGQRLAIVIEPGRRVPRQFTLMSFMMLVALIAVILGVMVEAPGLGIPLLIIATPAFWRTATAAHRRRFADRPMTMPEKLAGFFASFGLAGAIATIAVVSFVVVFFAVCYAGIGLASINWVPNGEMGIIGGLVLGAIVALVVVIVLIRYLWKRLD